MKLAVLLSGHFREYEECYEGFRKHIMEPYDPDIFIHTWSNLGMTVKRYQFDTEQTLDVNDIMEKYKPASICIEDPDRVNVNVDYRDVTGVPVPNIVNMYRKMSLVSDLCKNFNKEYSLVLKCRPDILFSGSFRENELVDVLGKDVVYVPDISNRQVNDHLCFGKPDMVFEYCNLYNHINEYYDPELTKVPNPSTEGSPIHAETLLYHHLLNVNKFHLATTRMSYHIPHKRRGM